MKNLSQLFLRTIKIHGTRLRSMSKNIITKMSNGKDKKE
jgi:hypothetical protein